jgi:hypothetical protein
MLLAVPQPHFVAADHRGVVDPQRRAGCSRQSACRAGALPRREVWVGRECGWKGARAINGSYSCAAPASRRSTAASCQVAPPPSRSSRRTSSSTIASRRARRRDAAAAARCRGASVIVLRMLPGAPYLFKTHDPVVPRTEANGRLVDRRGLHALGSFLAAAPVTSSSMADVRSRRKALGRCCSAGRTVS